MKGLPIYITDPKGFKKKIGSLFITRKGRIFAKTVERKKHFMRVVNGYGIQKEAFDKYLRGRKGGILIFEKDTGTKFFADIDTWTEKSHSANYGDGKQIFLSVKYMKKL